MQSLQAAETLLQSLTIPIQRLGGRVVFRTFNKALLAPIVFSNESDLMRETRRIIQSAARQPRSSTDLNAVWQDVLDQARQNDALKAYFVISDFVQTAGASMSDGTAAALHGVAQSSAFHLIRVEVDDASKGEQQQREIERLTTVIGAPVDARNGQAIADSAKSIFPLALHVKGNKLEAHNRSCMLVTAVGLRVRGADGKVSIEHQTPTMLEKRHGKLEWGIDEYSRVSIVDDRQQPLSGELLLRLLQSDLDAEAYLIDHELQVFVLPKLAIGAPITGQVTVLAVDASGVEEAVFHGSMRVLPSPEGHPAPLTGDVPDEMYGALRSKASHLTLRVKPEEGDEIQIDAVPLRIVPAVISEYGGKLLGIVAVLAIVWVATYRRWKRPFTGWDAVVTVLCYLLGSGPILFDWHEGVRLGMALLAISAACLMGWCSYVWMLPSERRTTARTRKLVDSGEWEAKFLRRRGYLVARVAGVVVLAVTGWATWWLLNRDYTDVAKNRYRLEQLRNLAQMDADEVRR